MYCQKSALFCFLILICSYGCSFQSDRERLPKESENQFDKAEVLPNKIPSELGVLRDIGKILPKEIEYLPDKFDRFSELTAFHKVFLDPLWVRLEEIAEDFQERGKLYDAWNNDKESLRVVFEGYDYNLQETLILVYDTLDIALKEPDPIFISNAFAYYFTRRYVHFDRRSLSRVFGISIECARINFAIGNADEAISTIELLSSFANRICVYDFISCARFYAYEDLIYRLLKDVPLERLTLSNIQRITGILTKTLRDVDAATDWFLYSERAILANIMASMLTDEKEYEEAKKTLRYLDAIIDKKQSMTQDQLREVEQWWLISKTDLDADLFAYKATLVPEGDIDIVPGQEILHNIIGTRALWVPGRISVNEQLKFKIVALIDMCNSALQETQ
jgi:tetratricopeptide (TPR) repeat protein